MHKYRDHETHLMHAAVWSGVAIVLTLLGGCSMGNHQLGQSAQSTRVSNSLRRLAGHRMAGHPLAVVDGCLYR